MSEVAPDLPHPGVTARALLERLAHIILRLLQFMPRLHDCDGVRVRPVRMHVVLIFTQSMSLPGSYAIKSSWSTV